MGFPSSVTPQRVRDVLRDLFAMSDLRTLCFDLSIDFESVPGGEVKSDKARELVLYCQKLGLEAELVSQIEQMRPGSLLSVPPTPPSSPIQSSGLPATVTATDFDLMYALAQLRSELENRAPYALRALERQSQLLQAAQQQGGGFTPTVRRVVIQLNQLAHLHLGTTLPALTGEDTTFRRGPLGELAWTADGLFNQPSSRETTRALENLASAMQYAAGFVAPQKNQASLRQALEQGGSGDALAAIVWLKTFPDAAFAPTLLAYLQRNPRPFNQYHAILALAAIVARQRLPHSLLTDIEAYARTAGAAMGDADRALVLADLQQAAQVALQTPPTAIVAVAEFYPYDTHGAWPAGVDQPSILGTLTSTFRRAIARHWQYQGQSVRVIPAEQMPFDQRADILLMGRVNVYQTGSGLGVHIRFLPPGVDEERTFGASVNPSAPGLADEMEKLAWQMAVDMVGPAAHHLPGLTYQKD